VFPCDFLIKVSKDLEKVWERCIVSTRERADKRIFPKISNIFSRAVQVDFRRTVLDVLISFFLNGS
jgi:hypothetical protein